ncbi:MAG: acetyl-CoA hydrolase/transferase C-terminal domain-containing protein [Dehalococcoidia bacterium]
MNVSTDFEAYLAPSRGPRAGRRADAATALAAIPDGGRVLIPTLCGVPERLLQALDEMRDRWSALEIVGGRLLDPIGPLQHPGAPFTFTTWQTGAGYNPAAAAGVLQVLPAQYSHTAGLFVADGAYPVDAVLVQVSPPGPQGHVSLGVSVGAVIDAVRSAPLVIAQVNASVPYTFGVSELSPDAFDFLVEMDGPLLELERAPPGPVAETIAGHVSSLVQDEATLQFGIGAVPEAIMARLTQRRDLGVHSGMISDGLIDLVESGALSNARKSIDAGVMVTAEVAGTRRLFNWVDRNPMVRMAPARYTHGPAVLARCHHLVAINSAVQVSLDGSVNAEAIDGRLISGPGGQPDFALGVFLAQDGTGIVALPSTAAGGQVSRIVRQLGPGAVVTVSRTLADRVVTEYGIAELRGRTLSQRADALRAVAHPDFRQELA